MPNFTVDPQTDPLISNEPIPVNSFPHNLSKSILIGILIFVLLFLIAYGAYWYTKNYLVLPSPQPTLSNTTPQTKNSFSNLNQSTPSASNGTTDWKTYINSTNHFSIDYPNSYEQLEENANYVRFFKGPYSSGQPFPETYISIQVKEKGTGSLRSWMFTQGLLPTATNPDPHVYSFDVVVGKTKGIAVSTPVNGGQRTIYIDKGTKVFQITYVFRGSELAEYDSLVSIFNQILSTFKFL